MRPFLHHWPIVSRNDTADAVDLSLTAITEMIEAYTVLSSSLIIRGHLRPHLTNGRL